MMDCEQVSKYDKITSTIPGIVMENNLGGFGHLPVTHHSAGPSMSYSWAWRNLSRSPCIIIPVIDGVVHNFCLLAHQLSFLSTRQN
jgi:hypothetical protein